MADTCGWAGTVLIIDLSKGKITRVPTSHYLLEEFIGGVGLNAKIFWELGCPEVDAFSPENPLIFSAGPLTGIYGPFGRAEVCTISPQCYPQELFSYSSVGGMFPAELKYAGYDGIVVLGKSDKPVYISIRDKEVEIKSAADLWGTDTFQAQQALLRHEPASSTLVIGPAGENRSRIAVILNETKFAAGMGGFGGVMGSKNLKAITVKGTGSVRIASPKDVLALAGAIAKENKRVRQRTSFKLPYMAPEATKKLFNDNYYVKQTGCFGCPNQCASVHYLPGTGMCACSCGDWQYSPMFSNAPKDIWEANVLLQKLGINTSDVLAGMPLIMQLAYKAGTITTKEITGVMNLPAPGWLGGTATDHEFLNSLLNKVAGGEEPYAGGTARFIEHFGKRLPRGKELVYQQNELYTARGYSFHHLDNLGSALHWAMDVRDPVDSCHEYKNSSPEALKHFGMPQYDSYQIMDTAKTRYEDVERLTKWVQENQCLKNSLPVCEFWSSMSSFFDPPQLDLRIFMSNMFTAVTGVNMDTERLSKVGERIWNLRRAIMVKRENRVRQDDTINEPYFEKAIICYMGSALGHKNGPIDKPKFEALKDRYYQLVGWDVKTGWPTRGKLESLGLKEVADGLAGSGRLP
jgi:aldehyde:ferredoxin oxidoreductase